MKFGVREICDVVLKAKTAQRVGNRVFYKNEPVIYFDTLKTSSMEGAATTVYAQGGRGNSRLVAWEGERTITFTMEDALISPAGFMILSGAGLVDGSDEVKIKVHHTEQTDNIVVANGATYVLLTEEPFDDSNSTEHYIYIMKLDAAGDVDAEPILAEFAGAVDKNGNEWADGTSTGMKYYAIAASDKNGYQNKVELKKGDIVLVDFYVEEGKGAHQIEITPDKFGGNYYLEASTLFRTPDGVDLAAEFVIPNCKIQSNFTFTMASSGDPSSFTFTMDAFPDYTRFDKTKKVLAAIQVVDHLGAEDEGVRKTTAHDPLDVKYI